MCNAKQSGITANKTKSKQNMIEPFDKTKSDKNNKKKWTLIIWVIILLIFKLIDY
jgi:hypothetical protein